MNKFHNSMIKRYRSLLWEIVANSRDDKVFLKVSEFGTFFLHVLRLNSVIFTLQNNRRYSDIW